MILPFGCSLRALSGVCRDECPWWNWIPLEPPTLSVRVRAPADTPKRDRFGPIPFWYGCQWREPVCDAIAPEGEQSLFRRYAPYAPPLALARARSTRWPQRQKKTGYCPSFFVLFLGGGFCSCMSLFAAASSFNSFAASTEAISSGFLALFFCFCFFSICANLSIS